MCFKAPVNTGKQDIKNMLIMDNPHQVKLHVFFKVGGNFLKTNQ